MGEIREGKRALERGFSLVEVIGVVVIVGILATIAVPKYISLSDKAQITADDEAAMTLRLAHTAKTAANAKTSPSDPWPTVAEVVGYVAGSGPAPASEKPLVDYSFTWSLSAWGNPSIGQTMTTSTIIWTDPTPLTGASCDDLKNGVLSSAFHFRPVIGYTPIALKDFVTTPVDRDGVDGVPYGDHVPRCRVGDFKWSYWSTNNLPGTNIYYAAYASDYPWKMTDTAAPYHSSGVYRVKTMTPSHYRFNCSGLSAKYGVTYKLNSSTGPETGNWSTMSTSSLTYSLVATSPYNLYEQNVNPPTTSWTCQRQGAAPAVVAANPGTYPIASDGSGYCLRAGMKLQAWQDSAMTTPTTATTDKVSVVSKKAVADAVNCPASLF